MSKPLFEILDWVDTPLGTLYLRRRELLDRAPGTLVTEVVIDHELLMSSLNTASEEELARRALAWRGGADEGLRVLVGGLGLGYTARAALASDRVGRVRVVEALGAVIEWLRAGKVPLSEALLADPRLELVEDDVYAALLGAPRGDERWDLILIDVDHSPSEPLGPVSAPFYTVAGLERVARHLAPGGVLAVWSALDDEPFARALAEAFPAAARERVTWVNELIDEGEETEDVIFLARAP
ncbi:MAG: spermidine synthase [Planctomycetota bacterium]